uniref:Uncharacterized protein n=1 Tax=Anguilla anguilla TaxID=7936 RepID=A0A0E9Y2L8_ANGAN
MILISCPWVSLTFLAPQ